MKNKRIVDAIGNIDDELILGAERITQKAKKPYLKWASVAASFALVAAAIVFVPMMMEDGEPPLIPEGDLIENVTGGEDTDSALARPIETYVEETNNVLEKPSDTDSENTNSVLTQPTDTEVIENVTVSDGGASGGIKGGIFALDSLNGRYGNKNVFEGETGFMEWPWNDKTISEKYYHLNFNGKEYTCRDSRKISSDLIETHLCNGEAWGYEYDYSYDGGFKHTKTVAIYKIKNVSEDAIIAVELDGEYYVYFTRDVEQPATFGKFMKLLGFEENVTLNKYSVYEKGKPEGYYEIDGSLVMTVLKDCASAPATGFDFTFDRTSYVAFTVTSEALGIYKKVFYVSPLGYVYTNIMEYGYGYNIGTAAAEKILSYLKSDYATECEMEPYMYYLCGVVTEIGDGYILLDDSVMCKNPEDGVVFKIDTSDPCVYRYVKNGFFGEGSVVQISFRNRIEVGENNTVSGAVSIWEGRLVDGDVLVEE